ncbi:hypothetical protein [Anaerotignum neopropionicum]|uniref:hypothetical protein n=1 Tax=Anaerotignum neopropionicum TaxID=36847 RepID=UPI000825A28A|nr:hypothetical protein [Anaerotignum neopropionicum]
MILVKVFDLAFFKKQVGFGNAQGLSLGLGCRLSRHPLKKARFFQAFFKLTKLILEIPFEKLFASQFFRS